MKILYAIQGTGNGHLSRAREIIPAIEKRAQVDLLVSGMHSEVELGYPIRYRAKGLGFKFGKNGGVDVLSTWWQGDVFRFMREIDNLDLKPYDLVINDFEPVSAWAARRQHVPCVGLSNQCTLLDAHIRRASAAQPDKFNNAVLKHYAPVDVAYGFHYMAHEPFVHTPVIRREIRETKPSAGSHYLVYLPFYNDAKIIKALANFPNVPWVVFSKHSKKPYTIGNIDVIPVNGKTFTKSFASCRGVLSAAGFGITTEALFLGKKLLVVPMKKQFEQAFNASALAMFGVNQIASLKRKWHADIAHWLDSTHTVEVQYPDHTQRVIDQILTDYTKQKLLVQEAMEIRLAK